MMGAVAARLKATEKKQAQPRDFFAPRKIFGRMVLPREGGGGLAEGGYYVVNKIFEIDGHRAPRNCGGAEGVDQGLDKNVRKAENRSRKSRWLSVLRRKNRIKAKRDNRENKFADIFEPMEVCCPAPL